MEEYDFYTTSMPTLDSSYAVDESTAMGLLGLGLVAILISILIGVAIYIFTSICLSKIFKKAGITSWYAWVPFLNIWKMFEMGGKPGALIFVNLIPGVGSLIYLVLYLMVIYKINERFGKDVAFFILAIFLSPVWLAILAFDKSTWDGVASTNQNPETTPAYPNYPQPTQQVQSMGQNMQPQVDQYQQQAPVQPQPQPQYSNPNYGNPVVNQEPQQPAQPQQQDQNNNQQPPQAPNQYFN